MNSKPNPVLWLLSGFASCAVLLTGILWWRGGGNPFLKTAPHVPPPLVVLPTAPSTPQPVAAAPAAAAPTAAHGAPAAEMPPSTDPVGVAPLPPAPPAAPALSAVPVPEAVTQAIASSDPSALANLAALAKDGTIPRNQLIEGAYQWGTLHLPADPAKPDEPLQEVIKLVSEARTPDERGFAAVALAGSGHSTEALETIRKAGGALKPEAPERFLIDEALKLATAVPDEPVPGNEGKMQATAPRAVPSPAPSPTTKAANPGKDEGTGETVKRPVLPHETPEDAARVARLLKEATDNPEPLAPTLTSPASSVSVVPLPPSGSSRQTKIQPAN